MKPSFRIALLFCFFSFSSFVSADVLPARKPIPPKDAPSHTVPQTVAAGPSCLSAQEAASLLQARKESRCGTYPAGLVRTKGLYFLGLSPKAEKAYQAYEEIDLHSKTSWQATKPLLKKKEAALQRAFQLYRAQYQAKDPQVRVGASVRSGDLFFAHHYALCTHIESHKDLFREKVISSIRERLVQVFAQRGVEKRFQQTFLQKFFRGAQGKKLVRCTTEKVKANYDKQIYKSVVPMYKRAFAFYRKSMDVAKGHAIHHAWLHRTQKVLEHLEKKGH